MTPRRKARKLNSHEHAPVEEQRSLVDLPELVLSAVAKHGFDSSNTAQPVWWYQRRKGHPMLAVARSLRDAVLSNLTKIRLDLQPQLLDSCCQPEARLLHRACCHAAPGLQVELDLGNNQHALLQLLQPALGVGGWQNVHRFTVALPEAEFLNLLGPAMPALRHVNVSLEGNDFGSGGMFSGLQLCKHLSALYLNDFMISPAAVKPAAAALAQLSALRDLHLCTYLLTDEAPGYNPARLVEQLTCLTALSLAVAQEVPEKVGSKFGLDALAAAARNPALQVFSLDPFADFKPAAADVQHLLEACPSLSDLDLQWARLSPDVLEVLLTHGTNITSLGAETLYTDVSLADRPCSWKCLKGLSDFNPTVLTLANLPLKGVTSIEFLDSCWGKDLDLATLQLPMDNTGVEDMLQLLRQAALNIATCPAWNVEPQDYIIVAGDPVAAYFGHEGTVIFSPEQRIHLLESLAPLGGPHITEFFGNIWGAWFEWGRPEVQALARSLRSEEVTTLTLNHCSLTDDFWAALGEFLPALESLQLGKDVTYSTLDIEQGFVIFCTKWFR